LRKQIKGRAQKLRKIQHPFIHLALLIGLVFSIVSINLVYGVENVQKVGGEEPLKKFLLTGKRFRVQGEFDKAIEALQAGLERAQQVGALKYQVEFLFQLGDIFWNQGKLSESENLYCQALVIARKRNFQKWQKRGEIILKIFGYYKQGKTLRRQRDYKGSISAFNKAIILAGRIKSPDHRLKCLRQLSVTYWEIFNFEKFYELNKEALTIARKINHKREIGQCLNNIGLYFWQLNDYSQALSYYFEALEIAKELGNLSQQSTCLNNIGNVYLRHKNFKKGLIYLKLAYELDKKLNDSYSIASDLNNIGEAYRSLAKEDKVNFIYSENSFIDALKIVNEKNFLSLKIKILNNLGLLYIDKNNLKEAYITFLEGLKLALKYNFSESIAVISNNIGRIMLKKNNLPKAKEYFEKSISLEDKLLGKEILWESFYGLGKCFEKEGRSDKAILFYEKSIEQIEKVRNKIALDVFKVSFSRDKLPVYEDWINLLYQEYKKMPNSENFEKVFLAVERAKAQAFLESLRVSQKVFQERLSKDLRQEERDFSWKFSQIIDRLRREKLSPEEKRKLLNEYNALEEKYMIHLVNLRKILPEANLYLPSPYPHINEVREYLSEKKIVVLEYFLGKKYSLLLVMGSRFFKIVPLPGEEDIVNSVRGYIKLLSDPPSKKFHGILAAKRLYAEFVFPGMKDLRQDVKHLIIIPDGLLHYLPFEALVSPGGNGQEEFLVERFTISYCPSLSSFFYLNQRKIQVNNKFFMAFGKPRYVGKTSLLRSSVSSKESLLLDIYQSKGFELTPLPYSRTEIKKISKFFAKKNRRIFLEEEARESVLKKEKLDDVLVLHFACHGFLDEEVPLRSALVLSSEEDSDEDGFFQVREIYTLPLNAELVVLSACQTARGMLEKGEGVLGLPRSFFYSGARTVVSSLWNVPDKSTAYFMEYFYEFLYQGKSKGEALRLAKIKMLKKFSHPHYWAAFVLNGEPFSLIKFN